MSKTCKVANFNLNRHNHSWASRIILIFPSETVVYDAVKDAILTGGYLAEGIPLHFTSAVVAGVTATFVASPVDVIKTRSESAIYIHCNANGISVIKYVRP